MKKYGIWGGNPKGIDEDVARCIETVFGGFGHGHQCVRKRGYGPNGEHCKQHDPEELKRRHEASMKKFSRQAETSKQNANDRRVGEWLRENKPNAYDVIIAGLK